jgi:hypothetical protein
MNKSEELKSLEREQGFEPTFQRIRSYLNLAGFFSGNTTGNANMLFLPYVFSGFYPEAESSFNAS